MSALASNSFLWAHDILRLSLSAHEWVLSCRLYSRENAARFGLDLKAGHVGFAITSDKRCFALDEASFQLLAVLSQPRMLDVMSEDTDVVSALARFAFDGLIEPSSISVDGTTFINTLPVLEPSRTMEFASLNIEQSDQAISFALDWCDVLGDDMSTYLYQFGRTQPLTRVEVSDIEKLAARLDRVQGLSRGEVSEHWISWHGDVKSTCRHKLYISAGVPLTVVARAFAKLPFLPRLRGAKIAAQPHQYARPDCIVLYLANDADINNWGNELVTAFEGVKGRGLTFTTPLDQAGVVSLGIDLPDEDGRSLSHRARQSVLIAEHISSAIKNSSNRDDQKHEISWRLFLDGYLGAGCVPTERYQTP